jgi:hypothetical protein
MKREIGHEFSIGVGANVIVLTFYLIHGEKLH